MPNKAEKWHAYCISNTFRNTFFWISTATFLKPSSKGILGNEKKTHLIHYLR